MSFAHNLTPEKALIFRITHRDNIPWILDNGIWCASAERQDPNFVSIGNRDLIASRMTRRVPAPPYGTLNDYVPFYFTPYSPMLLNIVTGWNVRQRSKAEIVVLVSSLHDVARERCQFLFTDRHAYLTLSRFSSNLEDLPSMVPWKGLQARDFKRDPEQPAKMERYEAEALIHHHLPVSALKGIVTYNDEVAERVRAALDQRGLQMAVHTRPGWFF